MVPSTGELLSVFVANAFTFVGAILFFVGAAMLISAMRPQPEADPAPAD